MPRKKPPSLLLVDGYNIIGSWADLIQLKDAVSLEAARRQLIEDLLGFSASRNYRTEVVFDAHYQRRPSARETLTSYFTVAYTDYLQTADTYIEARCARLRPEMHRQHVIVATSDRSHQQTVLGFGASWLSAQQLQTEVTLAATQMQRQRQKSAPSSGRFLFKRLDPSAQKKLSDMRLGLDDPAAPKKSTISKSNLAKGEHF
ncbi:NYN domain-containing protein [Vacuolonema iberomarrocanum]|uniref:NYN domain-containing protein n=1 Tax=Vacuolonema iberomarrocanum TaxID=3454632 RepID=UPI001A0E1931|nr:NYN domain-containing protein [filamentous cyanobacterium LEGE 07170]